MPYLFQTGERHPGVYTLETSRGGSGVLAAFANLHLFGKTGMRTLLGHLVEMAELLAGYEVPLDQESMGGTALHWCVIRNNPDMARWLLEQGANPEPVGFKWSRDGQTPLQLAVANGNSSMIRALKDAGVRR